MWPCKNVTDPTRLVIPHVKKLFIVLPTPWLKCRSRLLQDPMSKIFGHIQHPAWRSWSLQFRLIMWIKVGTFYLPNHATPWYLLTLNAGSPAFMFRSFADLLIYLYPTQCHIFLKNIQEDLFIGLDVIFRCQLHLLRTDLDSIVVSPSLIATRWMKHRLLLKSSW